MTGWQDVPAPGPAIGAAGWLRLVLRGAAMAFVTFGGLLLLLAVRLVEWPLWHPRRPLTPWITQAVCRLDCAILGLRLRVRGRPMRQKGAIVANHSSWLDILTLNACDRVCFVAKAEVAAWPGIGWLARATGTVFIRRNGAEAKEQQRVFEERLRHGHRLLFFPEGTSTDSLRVLPFKTSLFQAFFTSGLDRVMFIQPVTAVYHAPEGHDPRFYGWWGEMDLVPHLVQMLATPRHGSVEIIFHPELPVDGFEGRKALARYCEEVIRVAHPLARHG